MVYKEYGATIAPSNVSNTGFPIAMGTHIGGGRIVNNKDTLNSKHWCLLGEGATLSNQKANAIGQIWYDTLDSKYWKLDSWSGTNPVWVDVSTIFATRSYVDTAINDIPDPMIFKGSLGTGGTIISLPTASSSNTGFTYKVITAGTYAGQVAKIGDTFISDGTTWNLIPSGDDSGGGSVTSITLSATSPILIDNSAAITTSGTRTFSHDSSSGNKHIPSGGSTNQILKWSADGTAVWSNEVNTHYTSKNIVSSSAVGTTNTNTTNPYLNHIEESTVTSSHRINGSGATTVSSDVSGNITISSTDTNTTYSFATGTTNGAFSVTPSGGSATTISIYGLGSAAYTASTNYASSSHNHSVFTTAENGFVPKSVTSNTTDFLRRDGTWAAPPNSTTHLYVGATGTNTNGATTNGNTYIKLFDDTTAREQHKISGNGPSVVTSDATGNIIVGISDNSIGATQLNVTGNGTTTQYLRSDGDGSFTWADIPILNQNTTGSAGSVISSITFNNGGAGSASGITYNGGTARTISYNTIGASPSNHNHDYTTLLNLPNIYHADHNTAPNNFDLLYDEPNDVWLCSSSMRNGPLNDSGDVNPNYNTAFDNCVVQQFGDSLTTTKIQVLYITTGSVSNLTIGCVFYRMQDQGDKWKRIATYSDIENLQSQINSLINNKQDLITEVNVTLPSNNGPANYYPLTPQENKCINVYPYTANQLMYITINNINSLKECIIYLNPTKTGKLNTVNLPGYTYSGFPTNMSGNTRFMLSIFKNNVFINQILP